MDAFLTGFGASERLTWMIVMKHCGNYSWKDLKLHILNDRRNAHLNILVLRFTCRYQNWNSWLKCFRWLKTLNLIREDISWQKGVDDLYQSEQLLCTKLVCFFTRTRRLSLLRCGRKYLRLHLHPYRMMYVNVSECLLNKSNQNCAKDCLEECLNVYSLNMRCLWAHKDAEQVLERCSFW